MDAMINGFCHAMGAMVAGLIVFAVAVAVAFALLSDEEEVENDRAVARENEEDK